MRQGRTFVRIAVRLFATALCALSPFCRAGTISLPDSHLGERTVPLLLLSRRDVQADLRMGPEQVGEAERMIATLYAKASQLKGKTGEKAVAARRAIDEEQQRWIDERMSEPQRIRLLQIDLQWEGASALISRPSMVHALGLTPEQLGSIKRFAGESRERRVRGDDPIQVQRQFATQTLEVLSESQRKSWKAMLGTPFQPQLAGSERASR